MKDKRTKEQILKLLDNAIEQEERLVNKINALETELAECRKKVEDPRHELTEGSLPASKVSFRVDYYRTKENGLLKGIIEHLPSRQNKAFEGEGQLVIGHFMNHFLHEETGKKKKKKAQVVEKQDELQVAAENVGDDEASFFPERENTAIVEPENETIVLTAEEEHQALLNDVVATPTAPDETEQPEIKEIISNQPATEVTDTERGSRLLSKLKAKLEMETQTGSIFSGEKETEELPLPPSAPASKVPPIVERLLTKGTVSEKEPKPTRPTRKRRYEAVEIRRPRLLERLQAEHNRSINLAVQNN